MIKKHVIINKVSVEDLNNNLSLIHIYICINKKHLHLCNFIIVKYLFCLELVREGGTHNFSHEIVL